MVKQTICLNMIVKNEEHIIAETLGKLCDKIKFDYWIICDTGSTDNTIEVIQNFFKNENIDGEIFVDEWKDFAYNRTNALKNAYDKTDYLLLFDADDEIIGDFKLPTELIYDEYRFQFGHSNNYNVFNRSLLINNRKKWKFVGVLHEFLEPCDFNSTIFFIHGNYCINYNCLIGNRNINKNDKYLKDAKILEKAYYEALEKNDDIYLRYAFYCANSYLTCNKKALAIIWYLKRLSHGGGFQQELYVSCLALYNCYMDLNRNEIAIKYCIQSLLYDNERAEGLYHLIQYHCINNDDEKAYECYMLMKDFIENKYLTLPYQDKLLLDNNVLDFYLPYIMIIVGKKTMHYDTIEKMYLIIFHKKVRGIDKIYTSMLIQNLRFFIDYSLIKINDEFEKAFREYENFLLEN